MDEEQDLVTAQRYARGLACYESILAEDLRPEYHEYGRFEIDYRSIDVSTTNVDAVRCEILRARGFRPVVYATTVAVLNTRVEQENWVGPDGATVVELPVRPPEAAGKHWIGIYYSDRTSIILCPPDSIVQQVKGRTSLRGTGDLASDLDRFAAECDARASAGAEGLLAVDEKTFRLRAEVYERLFRPMTPDVVRLLDEVMVESASRPSRVVASLGLLLAAVCLAAALTSSSPPVLVASIVLMVLALAHVSKGWRRRRRALNRLVNAMEGTDAVGRDIARERDEG